MKPRTLTGRILVLVFAMGALLIVIFGSVARGTDPPVIEIAGPPPSSPNKHTLRIASFNLEGVSVLGLDWSKDIDERFAAMAERLGVNQPGLDVVLLQEAWKHVARRALLGHEGVMRNFPFRVDIAEQPGGAGLVILSRFPIERAHFHRFRTQGQCLKIWEADCISGKGVLAVRLSLGDRSVWVGNTHLIACYTAAGEPKTVCDQQDPNGNYRWEQILEARQVIEALAGRDAAIFGGDFNFTRTSRYYPLMTSPATQYQTPLQSLVTGRMQGWTAITEAVNESSHLDYIWTRPGSEFRWHALEKLHPVLNGPVTLRSGKQVPLSDHPVLATTFCLVRRDDPDNQCLLF